MKKLNLLGALALILGICSCSKADPDPEIVVKDTSTVYQLNYTKNSTAIVTFTSTTDWLLESIPEELTITPTSGTSGEQKISVKTNAANETNETKTYSFVIVGGDGTEAVRSKVSFKQPSVFTVSQTEYSVDAEGGKVKVDFTLNDSTEYTSETLPVMVAYDSTFKNMWAATASSSNNLTEESKAAPVILSGMATRSQTNHWVITFTIVPNTASTERTGSFAFCIEDGGESLYSTTLSMTQAGKKADESSDYSNDKKVSVLQTHTQGQGIPVVLMGDGFIDKDITDGTYDKVMNQAYEYMFSIEPTKSLKDYFDVYSVTAVSKNNGIGGSNSTAFSCAYGSGTTITGNKTKVRAYANCAVDSVKNEFQFGNGLFIVILNDTKYAGTCYLYSDGKACNPGYSQGYSVAFIPMTVASEHKGIGFEQVLHHEAIGHGFGKLDDEYSYEENGTITESAKTDLQRMQNLGFYWNVTTESDVTKSPWAAMAADSRYSSEKLSCYEGADTYTKGVYRATEVSIMVDNVGGFNAPSRELIYKRALMLANGGTLEYSYDDFVAFDKPSWSAASTSADTRAWQQAVAKDRFLPRLARPVVTIVRK